LGDNRKITLSNKIPCNSHKTFVQDISLERFSEDVDIAINREYLGFSGTLSKTQISDRLRRVACSFVREKLQFDLAIQFENSRLNPKNFAVKVNITSISTTDPEIIKVEYDSPFAEKTLTNKDLYNSVVEHRRVFIGLKGFDYSTLVPKTINIVPPENIIDLWKIDYEIMQNTMIYGSSLSFNKLINKIKQLNERINQIDW